MGICLVLWQHDRNKWKEKSQHDGTRLLSCGQCRNKTWVKRLNYQHYPLTLRKIYFGFFPNSLDYKRLLQEHTAILNVSNMHAPAACSLCAHYLIHSSSLSMQDGGAGRHSVSGGWVMGCRPAQLLQCQGLHLSHRLLLPGQCSGNWRGPFWSHCLWGCTEVKLKYRQGQNMPKSNTQQQTYLTNCHGARLIYLYHRWLLHQKNLSSFFCLIQKIFKFRHPGTLIRESRQDVHIYRCLHYLLHYFYMIQFFYSL